jgi:outer membrane receptor protein involved in Fe transport
MPAALVLFLSVGLPQIQMSVLRGEVQDPSGAAVPGARALLYTSELSSAREHRTGVEGRFAFENVPLGIYRLRIEAAGFRAHEETLRLDSSLVLERTILLALAGPDEQVVVRAGAPLFDERRTSTTTRLDDAFVRSLPRAGPGGSVGTVVATAAGWSTEDNGLLHSRGVDDGFLYVSNGVPRRDRIDTFFGSSLELEAVESVEILDGHLPVEYGYASGGVIQVVPRPSLAQPWSMDSALALASGESGGIGFSLGGGATEDIGVFFAGSYAGSSERYLDPVDPDNFNNRGQLLRFLSRADWRVSENDLLSFELSAGGSDFRVTNTLEQELAGQRQHQELRDDHESVVWQRSWSSDTVTSFVLYRHAFAARLFGSEWDTPISAAQDRRHERLGALGSITRQVGAHLVKGGFDFQRVEPRESFTFFVTADDADLTEAALAFGPDDPFVFEGEAVRHQGSLYVQDTFSLRDRLTVNAGIRFDHTSVLVSDGELSPRVGVSYFLPGIQMTLRGSYNRLFMPPQVENLLLSSSEQARSLSLGGGADVFPEKQNAFEAGFAKALGAWGLLDAVYWRRDVENYADPNVFFGTTVVFPNSVAEGEASGVSARLELSLGRDWSGFVSYGNAVVTQTGPINGGLFLEDDALDIGSGTSFTPDHDQRNVGAFGLTWRHPASGIWLALFGRHESGTPLEVDEDDLDEAMERRGAELVDFDRQRVHPRTLFDVAFGFSIPAGERVALDVQLDVRNVTDEAFAYNFSNPFSGTHFGPPRLVSVRVRVSFPAGSR